IHSMYLCSPYDYTLALDTDTYICHDITDLFRLLERFDIAAAHAPVRLSPQAGDFSQTYQNDEIPEGFPEMNCGCILFKKTKQVEDFFADWLHLYQAQIQQAVQPSHDQASFRAALYKSDLKIGILPPEYNCRFIFPCFVSGPVKILHGRHPDLPSVVRTINAETCPRVFLEWDTLQTSQLFLNLEILKAENNKLSEQLEALAIQLSSPRVNLPKKVFKRLAKVWNTLKGKF
ncbi:MAG: hypothetical protein SFW36_16915, partial [Leptolyngbyaceae cyanobacterium bins.59]|nr:hypothetical protein [Leptolyngbyaceae cyanobacterium bins.59]